MAYQIPQQLEYKEKIMFGLTFKQLVYALIFGTVSLFFFKRFESEFLKVIFTTIFSGLGIGFMFFNLEDYIKNYRNFLKFQKVDKGDPKLSNFIGVETTDESVIVTSDKKRIAVLRIQPMNFSLKPKNERDAIILGFQKFLNSLDFPIQILMNTESIDLDSYLNSLKAKVTEKEFVNIFEDYKKHLHDVISNNKIMNRVFYIVIPEQTDLGIQIEVCTEKLLSLNLKVERLNDDELKKLLVKFFMGNGEGEVKEAVIPNSINNKVDYIEINNQFQRTIYASGYPRVVEAGFLDKIVSSLADFSLSIHIKPYPIERMLLDLNRELQKQRADLYALQSKGIINPSLEIQYKDTRKTLEYLQKGEEKLFNISFYINCKANSLKELNLLTKKVESDLNSIMIPSKTAKLRMLQGLKSVAPLGIDELNLNRNITTQALSAFFPFTSQFLQVDNSGIWLGLNKNNIPVIKDIFKLPNPNGLVLSQSGGGKSYFCKLLITRYLLNDTKVMVIDPQGEYKNLVEKFRGQRVDLSRTSKTIINPLDLMGHEYAEKRLSLMDLMEVMLGKLSEPQKSFIDKALTDAYARKGITDDPTSWNNEPPILEDVLRILESLEKKAIQMEKTPLRSLINRLNMYTRGVFSFLNRKTSINFNNKFVCFDIGNLPKQVKPTIMFLVLDYVYMKMKSDLTRKILLIDESWSLLSRTEDASYIFEIVKTCRKFNMGLLLINQEVEGLLGSNAGKSVLANSAYTFLMRQKPAVIEGICGTFNLSPSEKSFLLTASVGEGLLIMEDDHTKLKVIASPEEHSLITTNADEIIKKKGEKQEVKEEKKSESPVKPQEKPVIKQESPIEPLQKQEEKKESPKEPEPKTKNVTIDLDADKGFFKYKDLNENEIKYLEARGYKVSMQESVLSNRKEKYLLRPRHNETVSHMFFIFDIKQFLEKYNIQTDIFTTKKPDLTFTLNKKQYAIEVETGVVLEKARNQLIEKVKMLNENYTDWFFVVTNKNYAHKYRKFGATTDQRGLKNYLIKFLKQKSVDIDDKQ